MSLTSFRSDPARRKKEMEISTYTGRYFLNTPGQGDHLPFLEDCHIRLQYYGANIDQDQFLKIENCLRGTSKKLGDHTLPSLPSIKTNQYPTMKPFTKESRASDPAWYIRDYDNEYSRWEQPWLDPQAHTEKRFEYNINTKQQARTESKHMDQASNADLIVGSWLPFLK